MTERSQRILDDLKARQQAGEYMACPRCGMDVMKTPVHTNALSRAAEAETPAGTEIPAADPPGGKRGYTRQSPAGAGTLSGCMAGMR